MPRSRRRRVVVSFPFGRLPAEIQCYIVLFLAEADFYHLALASHVTSEACRAVTEEMIKKFTKRIVVREQSKIYSVLPCGWRHGTYLSRWPSGMPRRQVSYVMGVKNGRDVTVGRNGNKLRELNYKDGYVHGEYRSWWSNGSLRRQVLYVMGQRNGEQVMRAASGNKYEEAHFKDGLLDGVCRSWHDNGQLGFQATFRAGCPVGTFSEWWPDGRPRIICKQKDEKKTEGIMNCWDHWQRRMESYVVGPLSYGRVHHYDTDGTLLWAKSSRTKGFPYRNERWNDPADPTYYSCFYFY